MCLLYLYVCSCLLQQLGYQISGLDLARITIHMMIERAHVERTNLVLVPRPIDRNSVLSIVLGRSERKFSVCCSYLFVRWHRPGELIRTLPEKLMANISCMRWRDLIYPLCAAISIRYPGYIHGLPKTAHVISLDSPSTSP